MEDPDLGKPQIGGIQRLRKQRLVILDAGIRQHDQAKRDECKATETNDEMRRSRGTEHWKMLAGRRVVFRTQTLTVQVILFIASPPSAAKSPGASPLARRCRVRGQAAGECASLSQSCAPG